jgi:hypothetical protein
MSRISPRAIRAPALGRSPFERKLRAKGGALKDCIISDTAGKQQFALLPIDAALCVVSGSSAAPGRPEFSDQRSFLSGCQQRDDRR